MLSNIPEWNHNESMQTRTTELKRKTKYGEKKLSIQDQSLMNVTSGSSALEYKIVSNASHVHPRIKIENKHD